MREPLPPGMEKPPIIDMYDRSTDPDDHIEKIKVVLDYISVRGSIKYKFFSHHPAERGHGMVQKPTRRLHRHMGRTVWPIHGILYCLAKAPKDISHLGGDSSEGGRTIEELHRKVQ
jgi:hypothetical protein